MYQPEHQYTTYYLQHPQYILLDMVQYMSKNLAVDVYRLRHCKSDSESHHPMCKLDNLHYMDHSHQ